MSFNTKIPVITLDGPGGTGKGTLCHMLAAHLGWHILDSGCLYRVMAWAAAKDIVVKSANRFKVRWPETSLNAFIQNQALVTARV